MKRGMIAGATLVVALLLLTSSAIAQVYRKPIPSLPVTFDPKHYTDGYSVLVSTQIYDRLFDFDEYQNIKTYLAEKWETSEGGRVWTIYLRKDVRFHDGRPFTAEDVDFTLLRLLEPESVKSRELSIIVGAEDYMKKRAKSVAGIQVLSPYEIRLTLKSPFPPFLAILAAMNTEILPKDFHGQTEAAFFRHPIGTGPFKFESLAPDHQVILSANQDYFLGKPFLEKVVFEKSDTENAIKGFNRGYYHDLEMYLGIDPRRITTTYTMIKAPMPEVSYLAFNLRKPPFNNVHVRRAMMYALNKKKLVDEYFPGRTPAVGYIPPGVGGYYPEQPPTSFNLDEAKEELKKSGLSQNVLSKPIVIVRPDNHPSTEGFKAFIEASFKKIGMTVVVKYLPLGELYRQYFSPRTFDMFNMKDSADYPEALFLLNYFLSDHPDNYSGFKSRTYDEILTKAGRSEDRYERFNLFRKAQEILQQEAVIIPLYYNIFEGIYQKNVRGVERPPYKSDSSPMRTVYFEKAANSS